MSSFFVVCLIQIICFYSTFWLYIEEKWHNKSYLTSLFVLAEESKSYSFETTQVCHVVFMFGQTIALTSSVSSIHTSL